MVVPGGGSSPLRCEGQVGTKQTLSTLMQSGATLKFFTTTLHFTIHLSFLSGEKSYIKTSCCCFFSHHNAAATAAAVAAAAGVRRHLFFLGKVSEGNMTARAPAKSEEVKQGVVG